MAVRPTHDSASANLRFSMVRVRIESGMNQQQATQQRNAREYLAGAERHGGKQPPADVSGQQQEKPEGA